MSYNPDQLIEIAAKYAEVADKSLVIEAKKKEKKKLDPKAKVRNRGTVCVPAESAKDKKDHFPINDEGQARNALARVHQYSSSPAWYSGSLKGLQALVSRKVHSKYPSIGKADKKKKSSASADLLAFAQEIRRQPTNLPSVKNPTWIATFIPQQGQPGGTRVLDNNLSANSWTDAADKIHDRFFEGFATNINYGDLGADGNPQFVKFESNDGKKRYFVTIQKNVDKKSSLDTDNSLVKKYAAGPPPMPKTPSWIQPPPKKEWLQPTKEDFEQRERMKAQEPLQHEEKTHKPGGRCIFCGDKLSNRQIHKGYDKCDNCMDRLERGEDMYEANDSSSKLAEIELMLVKYADLVVSDDPSSLK